MTHFFIKKFVNLEKYCVIYAVICHIYYEYPEKTEHLNITILYCFTNACAI